MGYRKIRTIEVIRALSLRSKYLVLSLIITLFSGVGVTDQAVGYELPSFTYQHFQPENLIANQRTQFSVFVEASEGVQDVRLYFRPDSASEYFFVELNRDDSGDFTGELPAFKESVKSVEYLFLWRNGPRRIIRTKPYQLAQAQSMVYLPSMGPSIRVYAEKSGDAIRELYGLVDETITIRPLPENKLLGMRAGLFDMASDTRYRYGYFGGFLFEPGENIVYGTKGYVNFVSDNVAEKESGVNEKTRSQQTPTGYPNVGGDGWRGVFYRTDRPSSRTKITAEIIQYGSGRITVITSLTGRGHYLTGFISKGLRGDVYLVDRFDDEIWTTHDVRKSSYVYFGFEDYVSRSRRDLYRIELSRSSEYDTEEGDGCFINAIKQ